MMNRPKSFYNKKFLFVLVMGMIIMYCAAITICYKLLEFNASQHKKHVIAQQQAELGKLSKEERAVKKAQSYIVENLNLIKPEQRLMLDYLQRKFDLDEKLSVQVSPLVILEDPATYPQEINFLARIAYPNKIVTVNKPRNSVDGPLLTNIYSANCDHIPLPANYWQTMEENYKEGGYSLTHDALAFAFLKDNGCEIPADKKALKENITQSMVGIAADKNTIADLRYEAIALLQLDGKNDLIDPAWVDDITSNQLDDGSWAEKKGETTPSDHATVLAFWALLESSRAGTPYEPLIHRPSDK